MDESMITGDRDIVDDPDVAVLASTYFDLLFGPLALSWHELFCVDDVKDFLFVITETFEYDIVFLRLFDSHDIYDLIFIRDLKRQNLFADLTFGFVEFQHNLTLVNSSCSFSL